MRRLYAPKEQRATRGKAHRGDATLGLYGYLYPGDTDRYADRLDGAADRTGKAITSPDESDQDGNGKETSF